MNLLYSAPVRVETTIRVDDVVHGMSAVVSPSLSWKRRSRENFPVGGYVGPQSCKLYWRGSLTSRNTVPRLLVLDFSVVRGKTVLEGRFRPNLVMLTVAGIWAAVCAWMTTAWLLSLVFQPGAQRTSFPFFGLYGVAVLGISMWMSRRQERTVLQFVEDIVHQQEMLWTVLRRSGKGVRGDVLPPVRGR